jgi:hypothetical protein
MLRAKAPEKPPDPGRQIGAAAVAAALGPDDAATPVAESSLPPRDPKPRSNIEALVQELAKTVAGRDLAERKAIIGQARSAFEAARRSAMPPPGESAVVADLKAFDDAAVMVVAEVPEPPAAAAAEDSTPIPPPVAAGEATADAPAIPADGPKAEKAAAPAVAPVDREKENGAGQDPPRLPRAPAPVWLRITLRVLIAAWLVLGGALGYAYLRHPVAAAPPTSPGPATPPVSALPPSASPTPGKAMPVPDPLIPME